MSKLVTDLIGSVVFDSWCLKSRERFSITPSLPENIRPVCMPLLDALWSRCNRHSFDGMLVTMPMAGGTPEISQWRP